MPMESSARTRLYDLAGQFLKTAPWQWLREDQLIVLKRSGVAEPDHISIMGAAGNHRCLALYVGNRGRHRFNLLQEQQVDGVVLTQGDTVALIFETPQLQASFTAREDLFPEELGEIKALGRRYRGENWPCFRSFQPGYAPHPVNDDEAGLLADAIEQALVVVPDLKDDPFADYRRGSGGAAERITRERGGDGVWRSSWSRDDMRLAAFPEPLPSEFLLAAAAELPAANAGLECQFQLIPAPIGEKGSRVLFPYLVMSVDAETGRVAGAELLSVQDQSHGALIASVPDTFLQHCIRHGKRPASIAVANAMSETLLRGTAGSLGIPLRRQDELPELDLALASMMQSLGM